MRTITLGLSIIILFFSCLDADPSKKDVPNLKKVPKRSIELLPSERLEDKTVVTRFNLVDVRSLNKEILVELKYATSDNFMRMVLYDRLKNAYLQKDVAERISKVQDYLSEIKPGYHLLIYDALRPVSVQQKMWDALDSLPPSQRGKFVSNPKNRSLHNLGAAVDITIVNQKGEPLDMGAGYDDIRERAYPSKEKQFLAEGKLSAVHIENRDLLRKVMKSQGFRQLETEWWHFNACSRSEGIAKYKVLLVEP